ncbi:MAG: 50S ribosomal protein L14e, partial [Candidatus Thorarchaeota archaeon]
MSLYKTGRVCVKTMGREAGSFCVIVEKQEDNYVVISGPKHISGVRRRRCNTHH